MRYLPLIFWLLFSGPAYGGWDIKLPQVVSGSTATGTTETFDSTGYDLTWTETDTESVLDPDATTQYNGASGQSLQANFTGTGTEAYTYYDFGSAASTRSVSFYLYLDDYTLPADNDVIYIASFGSVYSTISIYSEGIAIGIKRIAGVAQMYCKAPTSGSYVAVSGVLDSWVLVEIDYVQNGTTTVTINGSDSSCTAPDFGARYLSFGAIASIETDETLLMYIDDVEGVE